MVRGHSRITRPSAQARKGLFDALHDGVFSSVVRFFNTFGLSLINQPFFRTLEHGLGVALYECPSPHYTMRWASATCLHVCAWRGHTRIVQWLLEHGARCNVVDGYGRTPIYVAGNEEARALMWPFAAIIEEREVTPEPYMCSDGATAQELATVRKVVLDSSASANEWTHSECAICMVDFEQKVGCEISIMPCQHAFCSTCLERWLTTRNACPMCRTKLTVPEEREEGSDLPRPLGVAARTRLGVTTRVAPSPRAPTPSQPLTRLPRALRYLLVGASVPLVHDAA